MSTDTGLINSPFVRFSHGTPLYLPNNIHATASNLLKELENCSLDEAFRKTILRGNISGQRTVLPEATWYAIFQDFLNCYAREFSHSEHIQELLIKLLRLMSKSPLETAWKEVEKFLLDHIDQLSGWDKCWEKGDGEKRKVFREKDGNYYFHKLDDGILVQIEGMKTLPETRLDFIIGTIFHSFGLIMRILNTFSLFAISEDFARYPETYPRSLRLCIPELQSGTLMFHWHRSQFHQVRSTKWRPYNNLCDPTWLAEQLVAKLTVGLMQDSWSEHIERYAEKQNALDSDCLFQIDYVLDTSLVIGDEEEIYFSFEGKTFRWINGTPESKPILSVGFKEMNKPKDAEISVNKLLSFLVWQHQIPIRKTYGTSGPRRSIPLSWGPRMVGGLKIDAQHLLSRYVKSNSSKMELALSFYKEGLNSESVFYKFFNFWKIIEVAINQKKSRDDWIRSTSLHIRMEKQRVAEIMAREDIVVYLDYSCRSAIAHVYHEPFIDPDDLEDNIRISKDVHLVEELARIAINTVFFDQNITVS